MSNVINYLLLETFHRVPSQNQIFAFISYLSFSSSPLIAPLSLWKRLETINNRKLLEH